MTRIDHLKSGRYWAVSVAALIVFLFWIQKVSMRDLRRWLFWRPNFYKNVFGTPRKLSDLFSFSGQRLGICD